MPPRYFLRCLGTPELRSPGGEPVRFRTRKHMALLAFLAVEPRHHHRRERLADLLWPDASPTEGRHSLATALSVIRGKLGPKTFESTRETVRFVAPDLEVDLDRLARGDVLGDDLTPPLEMGGFLDDFEVSRAPEFALWRELRRAHWLPAIRRAFIVLMDRCRRTGDFTTIETLADRLLGLDELSEDAIRAKMEGRAFAGDRMSALRIFQQWRRKLEEELGATPSELVEGMALRLRQRSLEPPGTAHIPTVPTDQWRDRAFVGRGSQYRVAYEHWEHTRDSQGRHLLLLGDSGVGKTTLAERLVTATGLEGAVSSRVQCYEVEREIPYAAIGTLVRGMLDRPGASGTPPEWLAELARTVPAVAHRYPNLPPARESEGEAARLRLTEAVHQLASAVAEEHPLILVVDDVHLADDASVAVLHLVMRRTQEQRIMVVLSAREPELARSPNASRLKEVRHALALQPVELPPLTEEEMGQVVAALAEAHDCQLSPAVRRALLRASAGIPMIVELLFDDWRTHGDQCLALAIGAMTVDAEGTTAQDLFRQIVDRVVHNLSDVARAVLNLAAILGERLNDLPMYELVDLTLAQTLAGMSELTTMRILRDGGRDLEFRNELLRGYAYLSVPSPHRRALHGLIADRLIAAEAKGETVRGLMLAWHCYRAGRVDEARPFLLRGAREGILTGATHEVELALKSARGSLTGVTLDEADLLLAETLQEQSRWLESLTVLSEVSSQDPVIADGARALALIAQSHLVSDESAAHVGLLKARAGESAGSSSTTRARLLRASQGFVVFLQDRLIASEELRRVTLLSASFSGLRDNVIVSAVQGCLAGLSGQTLQFAPLITSLGEIACKTELANHSYSDLARLHQIRGCLLTSLGRYSDALESYEKCHQLSMKRGDDDGVAGARENLALCHLRLGTYFEARSWGERALESLPKEGHAWARARIRHKIAFAQAMMGCTQKAIEGGFSTSSAEGDSRLWVQQADGLLRADLLTVMGESRRAVQVAELTFSATSLRPLSRAYTGLVARWAARVEVGRGVRALLDDLFSECDLYDAMDKAEVLCARRQYLEANGDDWPEGDEEIWKALSQLPEAVTHQFGRLGMLDSRGR